MILYALIAALLIAVGNIIQKWGSLHLKSGRELMFKVNLFSFLLATVIVIITGPYKLPPMRDLLGLIIAGMLFSGLARLFFLIATYEDSSSTAAIGSVSTEAIAAAISGYLLAGDPLNKVLILSILLSSLSGLIMLSEKTVSNRAFWLGASAGTVIGIGIGLTKVILISGVSPIFATWVILGAGAIAGVFVGKPTTHFSKRDIPLLVAAGCFLIAKVFSYYALRSNPTAVVTVTILTYPVLILVISSIIGFSHEKVSLRKAVASTLSVFAAGLAQFS